VKERQSIIRNFRWLAGTNLAVKPIWLFFLFYSARILGPNEFGVYMLALSYVSIVYTFLEGGIDIYTVRELSSGKKEFQHLFPNTLFIKSVTGILTIGVVLILAFFVLSSTVPGIILIYGGVYILAYSLTTHVRFIFRSFEVLKYEAISIFVEKISVVSLCLIALLWRSSAVFFMAAFSAGYLITSVITLGIMLKKIGLPEWRISWKYLWHDAGLWLVRKPRGLWHFGRRAASGGGCAPLPVLRALRKRRGFPEPAGRGGLRGRRAALL
jgi:O-antigen/teichoic acid export membrane protein